VIGFWLRFAVRGLLRRRARSGITAVAIAVGVAVLVFLGSIMVGVGDAMIENSVALSTGHVMIDSEQPRELVAHWRGLPAAPRGAREVLPRLVAPVTLSNQDKELVARVYLAGVLPARERKVSAIPARRVSGKYLSTSGREPELFLGARSAEDLDVGPGDAVLVRLLDGHELEARVAGIFKTGIERLDHGVAHIHLDQLTGIGSKRARGAVPVFFAGDDARKYRGEVAIFFAPGTDTREALANAAALLRPGETARSWEELIPELKQLTHLNAISMMIVIGLVVVLMAAGVSNTVLVSVMDRYRDFGVLKAMGVTPREILRLVLFETGLMCLVAGACGLLLGFAAVYHFGQAGIDLSQYASENPHFVISSVIHPRMTWEMAVTPVGAVLGFSVLTSLWPAWIAARGRAAEIMRASA
jgi:ABC-type lipoprotein release transport system permease subunit